jgi:hypothetical protein
VFNFKKDRHGAKPNQSILVMASVETYFYLTEPMMRFELMTSSLPRKRSTPELHRQNPYYKEMDKLTLNPIKIEFNLERETRFELATFSLEG